MTSKKANKKYDSSTVNLGYSILKEKLDKEKQKLKQILDELDKIEDIPINIQNIIEKERKYIEKMEDEISKMKQDSIALINQIFDNIIIFYIMNFMNKAHKNVHYFRSLINCE